MSKNLAKDVYSRYPLTTWSVVIVWVVIFFTLGMAFGDPDHPTTESIVFLSIMGGPFVIVIIVTGLTFWFKSLSEEWKEDPKEKKKLNRDW